MGGTICNYVPAWADAINDHNEAAATADVLNLKALVIGNGIVNETEQSTAKYVKSTNADSVGPGAGMRTTAPFL